MVNPLFGDQRVDLLGKALAGLARRQQALSGNIANLDTPGYKRQDVDFESELRAASGGAALRTTDPRHIATSRGSSGSLLAGLTGDAPHSTSPRNDGNDVDLDYEMTRLAETSLRYDMLVQATGTRLATLKDIVSRIA